MSKHTSELENWRIKSAKGSLTQIFGIAINNLDRILIPSEDKDILITDIVELNKKIHSIIDKQGIKE
jgi:hypothetical protein